MINLKQSITILVGLFLIGTMVGCASTGKTTGDTNSEVENKSTSSEEHLTLEDHLRRLGGVRVSGSGSNIQVTIRGKMSVSNPDEQPLFVLNGREIGHSYSRVSEMVSTHVIKSVEAIPASRASNYGLKGGAGVIEIVTE